MAALPLLRACCPFRKEWNFHQAHDAPQEAKHNASDTNWRQSDIKTLF
jgi:hypothetical protein